MIRPLIIAAGLALIAGAAHAEDPCKAPVSGYRPGQVITAPVVHGIDGDGLCLMLGRDPSQWLEIRLADFYAPELHAPGGRHAKSVIDRLVGRRAVCAVTRGKGGRWVSYDRLIAACTVEGRPVADILAAAGVQQGGQGR